MKNSCLWTFGKIYFSLPGRAHASYAAKDPCHIHRSFPYTDLHSGHMAVIASEAGGVCQFWPSGAERACLPTFRSHMFKRLLIRINPYQLNVQEIESNEMKLVKTIHPFHPVLKPPLKGLPCHTRVLRITSGIHTPSLQGLLPFLGGAW